MNIAPIGQNYNFNNNKASFKGINEEKAFMAVVEGAGLKDAVYNSFLMDNKAINAYLDNCFKQLRKTFKDFHPKALKSTGKENKGKRAFGFTLPNGEEITIERVKDKLLYIAKNNVNKDLTKFSGINYYCSRHNSGDCLEFTRSIQSAQSIDHYYITAATDNMYDWQKGTFDSFQPITQAYLGIEGKTARLFPSRK